MGGNDASVTEARGTSTYRAAARAAKAALHILILCWKIVRKEELNIVQAT